MAVRSGEWKMKSDDPRLRIIRDEMDDETFDAVLKNINEAEEENIRSKKRSNDSPHG